MPRWIRVSAGPILVSGLLIGAVLGGAFWRSADEPAQAGGCRARTDTVRQIRADDVLTRRPGQATFGAVSEELACGEPGSFGAVSVRMTTRLGEDGVRAFYADVAGRSGWQPFEDSPQVYSATKNVGGCPWWFSVRTEDTGYRLRVLYQPDGVPGGDCLWASAEPLLLRFSAPAR